MNPDNPNFRTAEDWEKICERHVKRINELENLVIILKESIDLKDEAYRLARESADIFRRELAKATREMDPMGYFVREEDC
jgi:hypothetical protein